MRKTAIIIWIFLGITQPLIAQTTNPASCIAMDTMAAELRSQGAATLEKIDEIYSTVGLTQASEQTAQQCLDVMVAMSKLTEASIGQASRTIRRTDIQTVDHAFKWLPSKGDAMTLWTHNGSEVAWEVGPGNERRVWYWNPRTALNGFGIARGTLLFEGQRQGSIMTGEARSFTRNCGVFIYPVQGPISTDEREVRMTGQRPVVDDDCRITRSADDTLVFQFSKDSPDERIVTQVSSDAIVAQPSQGADPKTYRVTGVATGLNLRADTAGIRRAGTTCVSDETVGEWCKVIWENYEGWVASDFLTIEN